MNLHLNTIAIGYQINYPAALKSEREALLNLQKRNDIIITKADKGACSK